MKTKLVRSENFSIYDESKIVVHLYIKVIMVLKEALVTVEIKNAIAMPIIPNSVPTKIINDKYVIVCKPVAIKGATGEWPTATV